MQIPNFLHKDELKYMGIATLFAFILFVLIIPTMLTYIQNLNPYVQFLIFNVGLFAFFNILLKGFTINEKLPLKESFGFLFLFMALDIWIPPLMVSPTGQLLTGTILSASASDYIFGNLAISMGLSGILVYLFTYILVPFVLLFIAARLIPNFVRHI